MEEKLRGSEREIGKEGEKEREGRRGKGGNMKGERHHLNCEWYMEIFAYHYPVLHYIPGM